MTVFGLRAAFSVRHRTPCIFWSLIVIISVKYLALVLNADNRGEGGILALTSLVTPVGAPHGGRRVMIMLGLFATALLYGDGMITPAISVLSAVEGLEVATPFFEPFVIPTTIAILIGSIRLSSRDDAFRQDLPGSNPHRVWDRATVRRAL